MEDGADDAIAFRGEGGVARGVSAAIHWSRIERSIGTDQVDAIVGEGYRSGGGGGCVRREGHVIVHGRGRELRSEGRRSVALSRRNSNRGGGGRLIGVDGEVQAPAAADLAPAARRVLQHIQLPRACCAASIKGQSDGAGTRRLRTPQRRREKETGLWRGGRKYALVLVGA